MTRRGLAPAAAALVGSLALGAGLASGALTDDGTSKDPAGDVRAKGLTKAQASAMDIVSVRMTGAKNVGFFVKVTFRGNIEQELGRGALARAAAALVLVPKPHQGTAAGIVSSGTGKIGTVRRHTKSTRVGAFRRGKVLTFFLLGPGYEKIKSARAETVLDAGPLGKRLAALEGGVPYIGPRLWDKFISLHPIDQHVQTADASGLSCPELQDLIDSINSDLDDPWFTEHAGAAVTKALDAFRATVRSLLDKCGRPPPAVGATFAWSRFSSNEVAGTGRFTGPAKRLDRVRVVLPEGIEITNHLCPTQLPNSVVSGNRIDCGGGILATGEPFKLNLQTIPVPGNGMGGTLFGYAADTPFGPFQITGP